jgi:hypothetical protein
MRTPLQILLGDILLLQVAALALNGSQIVFYPHVPQPLMNLWSGVFPVVGIIFSMAMVMLSVSWLLALPALAPP